MILVESSTNLCNINLAYSNQGAPVGISICYGF